MEKAIEFNVISKPQHYNKPGCTEAWDVIDGSIRGYFGGLGYLAGNTIKYLLRWPYKNGVEDLRKARRYLQRITEFDMYFYREESDVPTSIQATTWIDGWCPENESGPIRKLTMLATLRAIKMKDRQDAMDIIDILDVMIELKEGQENDE